MKNININKNIVLIGTPGAGKSTIGDILAKNINLPFYDVDSYIENKQGKSINNIFEKGEEYFRNIESESIKEIIKKTPSVIATGGGVVKIPENMKVLKENSIIIFINRPVDNIAKDIDVSTRPLLAGNVSKIYELYKERYDLYKKYCDYEVFNNKDVNYAINKIYDILEVIF
ncbi:shikimate kinase [Clostridium acetireducens DSM 10703]|uniref:Shikimate kinase n=1 Tax=Clostridium acetireducens DSM 10703 TaxID=1121290 RepID=A0A1E8EYM8_9CLOT|nr:shikimate kinase [Clostridium acetireducens]OFI06082.1 shikimate kinase [Clostridium acetireducens DSM 10703]